MKPCMTCGRGIIRDVPCKHCHPTAATITDTERMDEIKWKYEGTSKPATGTLWSREEIGALLLALEQRDKTITELHERIHMMGEVGLQNDNLTERLSDLRTRLVKANRGWHDSEEERLGLLDKNKLILSALEDGLDAIHSGYLDRATAVLNKALLKARGQNRERAKGARCKS
jgi:hypothetical protein